MGDEARWLYMRWGRYTDWACVTCNDEPWGLGVWEDRLGYDHVGRLVTPAAESWLRSSTGVEWRALVPCNDCDGRHHDSADCSNGPED
jgi:hypothetical protein